MTKTLINNSIKNRLPRRWGNGLLVVVCLTVWSISQADTMSNQPPASGGGTMRWSKLWVDPSGQGNDLDGDAICYEDFVLTNAAQINHLEWWGDGPPNHGFQIEFWKQDPGTIAYQPYAVFRSLGAQPEKSYTITSYSAVGDPTGTTHYSVNLPTPVTLAANNSSNPRWFVAIIALTDVAYLEWNWAQGIGGSSHTFQFIRGGSPAGGDWYVVLPEGRSMIVSGTYTTASLNGTIELQNLAVSPAGRSAALECRAPGTTNVLYSYPITLDGAGHYTISILPAGTFDVAVKFDHWLRAMAPSQTMVNGPNTVNLSLVNGDANGDNGIDLNDLNQIFITFDMSDPIVDLDGSGLVDLPDMNIVFINFAMTGVN
jgi:hypothetical protein